MGSPEEVRSWKGRVAELISIIQSSKDLPDDQILRVCFFLPHRRCDSVIRGVEIIKCRPMLFSNVRCSANNNIAIIIGEKAAFSV